MTNSTHQGIDWKAFRARIEYEDGLLTARVNILLIVNGLGATAAGLSPDASAPVLIAGVVLLTNLLLLLCTVQTALLLRRLTTDYMREASDPIDMRVRSYLSWVPRGMRSTFILGIWLPVTVLVAWVVALWGLATS